MSAKTTARVSFRTKFAYALPAFFLAVVGIPVYVYIPKFYTDVVGVDITALGYLLFSVRVFDAVTDPAIGYISDRTESGSGRRRPYIAIGAVFVALAMYLLFNPPHGSQSLVTVWFAATIYALFLAWTIVTVPYESLGPEITFDYNERTSLFGLRDGFLIAGTLAAASSPAAAQWVLGLDGGAAGERSKFFWIAIFYAPLLIASCWWCTLVIREKRIQSKARSAGIISGLRDTLRNRPFRVLLLAYTISAIGNNLPATLILFYVQYVLQSSLADAFLLLYFVTGILFLPGWIWIAGKTGKKWAWLASMAVNTGAFIGVFFLGPGDAVIYGILVFLSGIGFGATLALPSAIQADVIDYDELLTGDRREGQYIGLWSIAKKLAAAIGIGVSLPILGLVGYVPNIDQPDSVLLTLRILYALVPSVCNLIALLIALGYPISGRMHNDIRLAIERRKKGQPFVNPIEPARAVAR